MRPMGDRRASVRVEIVGTLWARLEITQPTRVIDIGPGGALIAVPVALAVDSVQPVHIALQDQDVVVDARICHVRLASGLAEPPEYLVGIEFLPALDAVGPAAG